MVGPAGHAAVLGAMCLAALLPQASAAQPTDSHRELTTALTALRARGCAGNPGTKTALRPVDPLREAARRIARGATPAAATQAAGYRAKTLFHVRLSGYRSTSAIAATVARQYCKQITDPRLTELGLHREGQGYWILLAEPFAPPPPSAAAAVAARVLALTNEARAHPRSCGTQRFSAAPPVRNNPLLERAAAAHAADMARHGVLQHEGSDGSSPAQRVSRTGYRWRSVGENVASGQTTPEQVVREWVRSPEHCANLMEPAFTEMGVAYAANMRSEGGVYWAQVFGRLR